MILAWKWWWTPVEKKYKSSIDLLSKLWIKTGRRKKITKIYSALIRSSKGFWEESSSLLLWLVFGDDGREEWFQAPPPPRVNHWHSAASWWVGCSPLPLTKAQGLQNQRSEREWSCWGAGPGGGGGWGLQCVHHIQKYPGVRSYLTFTTAQEPTKVQCTN